jgi:soluble lytic murein transglycosylase-like protein
MVMAIIEHESSGQADAENGGCKGLMQIYEKYHRDRVLE